MSLLHEIQESIVQEGAGLGSILLKLRLLASRLGSDLLEDWVKHESEGYPQDIEVPSYRIVNVSYHGTWAGPFESGLNNVPIPPHLIEEYAGKKWVNYEVRESVAAVDELVKNNGERGGLIGIDASNLILLLQGKLYEGYNCIDIKATISRSAFTEIQQAVRNRILELTIELEKAIPEASQVNFGPAGEQKANPEKVQQITQQIIYGNVTTAVTGGHGSNFMISVGERDTESLIEFLSESGFPEKDATEIANIMESEEPLSVDEPFGEKARKWISTTFVKAAKEIWGISINVATKVLSEAALKYYGLK